MITIPMTVTASSCVLPVALYSLNIPFDMEVEARYSPNPMYDGEYEVTPKAWDETILPTNGKTMSDDVTVKIIPMFETHNPTGTTIYIASEV